MKSTWKLHGWDGGQDGRPLTSSFRLLTSRTVLPPADTPGIPTRPAAAAAAAAAALGMARGLRAPGTAATGSPNFKIKRILRNTHKSFTNTNLSTQAAGAQLHSRFLEGNVVTLRQAG